ncbi:vitamin K epoxide reductase family protein [mine drainage metagenome]|uniref:Vitamin K epoxide reductase family protein n=1 Tax=mine drainage metagenome TaxID=410659 RepID=A0A1J5R1V4_9ZZZZ
MPNASRAAQRPAEPTDPDRGTSEDEDDLPSGWRHSNGWIFGVMLVAAALSLLGSFVLSNDAVILAGNKNAALTCNVNAVISCGTVGNSWQAALLGFPNAFLGVAFAPVVMTIAVAGMVGVRFPRWFMLGAQLMYTIALGFAYWLFSQSMFVIGALCPWCLLVMLATTVSFATLLHANVLQDNLYLPRRLQRRLLEMVRSDVDAYLLVTWIVLLAASIVLKYGSRLLA